MRTSKMISTISYNSIPFLKLKLDSLIKEHKIVFYMFIKHLPEEDELKEHIHLFIEPNTTIDTMSIQDLLKEYDPNHKLPLGCISFSKSQTDDWILYCQHYPPYLAFKNQSRECIYQKSDFEYSDPDTFEAFYHHAFYESEFAERFVILNMLNDKNVAPHELVLSGHIPLGMASQLNALKFMQEHYGKCDRNGNQTHSPIINNCE